MVGGAVVCLRKLTLICAIYLLKPTTMEELKVHDEPIINGMKYLFPKYSHEPFYLFTLFFRGGGGTSYGVWMENM